jgi:hypothetical protein
LSAIFTASAYFIVGALLALFSLLENAPLLGPLLLDLTIFQRRKQIKNKQDTK